MAIAFPCTVVGIRENSFLVKLFFSFTVKMASCAALLVVEFCDLKKFGQSASSCIFGQSKPSYLDVDQAGHILSQTAAGASVEKAVERAGLIAICMIRVRSSTDPQAWEHFLKGCLEVFVAISMKGAMDGAYKACVYSPSLHFAYGEAKLPERAARPKAIWGAGNYSGETRKNFSGETRFFFLGNAEFVLGNFWVGPGQKELLHNPFSGKFPGISQKTFLVSGKSFTEEFFLRGPPLPRLGGRPEITAIILTRTVQKQPTSGQKLTWEATH